MMMKKVTLGFSVLALASAFVIGCKPEKNVEPVADTETQSAVYASYMNYVVTDVQMICSFLGENAFDNNFNRTFYGQYPGTTATATAVRDTFNIMHGIPPTPHDQLAVSWNTTKCVDGNVRDGSIFVYIPQSNNKRYSREPGWQGEVHFYSYKINGWRVQNFDSTVPCYLYNTVKTSSTSPFNPLTQKLTFKFGGKLKFTHPTDPKKNMVWQGELFSTVENTSDPLVINPNLKSAISWSLANLTWYGDLQGTVPQIDSEGNVTPNVNYTMKINKETPLTRDMKCSPDQVSGVAFTPTGGVLQRDDQHHPFKKGVASFTVGSNYPRQIYYGNEGEPQLPLQCDNTGEVLIKGISYRVDFMK